MFPANKFHRKQHKTVNPLPNTYQSYFYPKRPPPKGRKFRTKYFYKTKAISWLIATIGLFWQIQQVSVIYFEYRTRVDIEIDLPGNITMPGITICVQLAFNQSVGERYFLPTDLIKHDIRDLYATLPMKVLYNLKTEDVKIKCRTPFPELIKINPNGDDSCENYVKPVQSLHYNWELNRVYKCETFFYQPPSKPSIQVITADAKDFYQIEFSTKGNYSIGIFVHNPGEILHLIEADTFHFWLQKTEEIILVTTKTTTHLLPTPYRTDCVDYRNMPFGRQSCIYKCRFDEVSTNCYLWPEDVPVLHSNNMTFNRKGQFCDQSDRTICMQKNRCKSACYQLWYITTLTSTKGVYQRPEKTRLFVRRPFNAELVYNYGPKMAEIEFICYIASCFGIWFGISFADISQFAINSTTKRVNKQKQKFKISKN